MERLKLLRLNDLPEDLTKTLIANLFLDAGTGTADGGKIRLIGQHTRVDRPLTAAPRFALVNGTAVIKENAVPVNDFHLDDIAGNTQIFLLDLIKVHAKMSAHPLNILLIERNRCFTMAAIAALLAIKNISLINHHIYR